MFKSKKRVTKNSPETTIVFTTFERSSIAKKSLKSLQKAVTHVRDRIKIIVVDATDNLTKAKWLRQQEVDDFVWTPKGTSAATSRNLGVQLMLDKYASENICFVEDDVLYSKNWYGTIYKACKENYGKLSPLNLAYGMFTATSQSIHPDRKMIDKSNNLIAYMFGAVADQRFMPVHHYLSVLRRWDSDVLGISYNQTGGQTLRNTMRGYCGGIIRDSSLCKVIGKTKSSWVDKRNPGPPAHSFDKEDYLPVVEEVKKDGEYDK